MVALLAPLLTPLPASAAVTAEAHVPRAAGFVQTVVGELHTCGLTAQGTTHCWGSNYYGQLGTTTNSGTVTPNPTPQTVDQGSLRFASITASGVHTCGLTAEGTTHCWGSNSYGQLGTTTNSGIWTPNPTLQTVDQGALRFATLTAGGEHTCGLTADGATHCWGSNSFGELGTTTNNGTITPNPTLQTVDQGTLRFATITASLTHTCGLTADGTTHCWGSNRFGELGTSTNSGTDTSNPTPQTVDQGTQRFTTITASGYYTCGLTAEGTTHCWGSNRFGQLGTTTNSGTSTPTPNPQTVDQGTLRFTTITTGFAQTCGLTADGTTHCWGSNRFGELGTTTNSGTNTPTPIPQTVDQGTLRFATVTAGLTHTCGLTADGTTHCWGSNLSGQLGTTANNGTFDPNPTLQTVDTSSLPLGQAFAQTVGGELHTCGLTAQGTAHCWGYNSFGQLGTTTNSGTVTPIPTPQAVDQGTLRFTTLTAGSHHTCGLTADGTAHCWGYNNFGQLGTTSNNTTYNPNPNPQAVDQGTLRFATITAGGAHTCGLTADGTTHCWGLNRFGQLGDTTNSGTVTPTPTPQTVDQGTLRFATITAGAAEHTCGLTADGTTHCWGYNNFGQLGTTTNSGTVTPNPTPQTVDQGSLRFTTITIGNAHTCGLTADGTTHCWGVNRYGQLGTTNNNNTNTGNPTLQAVDQGTLRFATLTAGGEHTCGLTADGTAHCWGLNNSGQLGNTNNSGTVTPNPTPQTVDQGTLRFAIITVGRNHTCGHTADGTALCWGLNNSGQLGNTNNNGTNTANPTPQTIDVLVTGVDATVVGNLGADVVLDPSFDGVGPVSVVWTNPSDAAAGTATDLTLPVTVESSSYGDWTATATNRFGESATATITVASVPTAVITGPDTVQSGTSADLDGTSSSDNDGDTIVEHEWDLDDDGLFAETGGDATRGDETGPTPTFSATGLPSGTPFPVALRVSDGTFTSAIVTHEFTITAPASGSSSDSTPPPATFRPAPTDTGDGPRYGPIDLSAGDTLDTTRDNPVPIDAAVTIPSPSTVTIDLPTTDPDSVTAPAGTELGSRAAVITLEPPTTSPTTVVLTPGEGLFTPGADLSTLTVLHNGAPVPACDADNPVDPCISAAGPDGVTVRTTEGGVFVLGVTATNPIAAYCDGINDGINRFTDVPETSPHRTAIECLADGGVIAGTSDTTYNPSGMLTRAQAASLLDRAATSLGLTLPADRETNFTDVPDTSPHRGAIFRLARAGVINGTTPDTFAPNQPITRAQFSALALRLFTTITGTTPIGPDVFTDDDGTVFETVLNQAAAIGLVAGNNGLVQPGAHVTRDQAASIIARLLGRLSTT